MAAVYHTWQACHGRRLRALVSGAIVSCCVAQSRHLQAYSQPVSEISPSLACPIPVNLTVTCRSAVAAVYHTSIVRGECTYCKSSYTWPDCTIGENVEAYHASLWRTWWRNGYGIGQWRSQGEGWVGGVQTPALKNVKKIQKIKVSKIRKAEVCTC